ncbi:hypothetical protein F2Q69_00029915 [Brassica cretica]|uniref:Uncharacterized protein n=1 Tax=Brassica cretica TaxID=69181 RepID=A0A8S9S947_BRACR|nr:hypothetical protein F2Q69_00029915 [Brassica cretica]
MRENPTALLHFTCFSPMITLGIFPTHDRDAGHLFFNCQTQLVAQAVLQSLSTRESTEYGENSRSSKLVKMLPDNPRLLSMIL